MKVVRNLDLERYMGRWYEIATLPSMFHPKNGANTRATYTLDQAGTVTVLNETWTDGRRHNSESTVYRADHGSDEAKLKIKFYMPPFLPIMPIVGDYWVLHIDDAYQYALVGQPSRKYLWILCRQPQMDDGVYNELVEKAKEEGYDVSQLRKTAHPDSPPESQDSTSWFKSLFGK